MNNHVCDVNCFVNYESKIMDRIERKLELHKERDLTLFGGTISPECAMKLLKASKGYCSICSKRLILHDWSAYAPEQFSFDRLNDRESHHESNLQITCYRCNIYKAAMMYNKPVTDFITRPNVRIHKSCFSDEIH